MGIRLVLGIGNPGPQYAGTRHNLGFETVRAVARRLNAEETVNRYKAVCRLTKRGSHQVMLLEPQTFVNLSGITAKAVMDAYEANPGNLLVVTDDVHLDSGKLRMRRQGSSGGHNGLKSIIAHCGSEKFPRLKIGIGIGPGTDRVSFVLGTYAGEERTVLEGAVERGADAVLAWLDGGIDRSMRFVN